MDWSSWGPAGHDDLTRRPARTVPDVPAAPGTVVEDVASGFTGAVIGIERSGGVHVVVLEDHRGVRRGFPLGGGFWIDGEPVTLVTPTAAAPAAPARNDLPSIAREIVKLPPEGFPTLEAGKPETDYQLQQGLVVLRAMAQQRRAAR